MTTRFGSTPVSALCLLFFSLILQLGFSSADHEYTCTLYEETITCVSEYDSNSYTDRHCCYRRADYSLTCNHTLDCENFHFYGDPVYHDIEDEDDEDDGLGTWDYVRIGTIVGPVVAVLATFICTMITAYVVRRKRREARAHQPTAIASTTTTGVTMYPTQQSNRTGYAYPTQQYTYIGLQPATNPTPHNYSTPADYTTPAHYSTSADPQTGQTDTESPASPPSYGQAAGLAHADSAAPTMSNNN